ncbi:FMN-binding domain protein [Caldicellulosiruptor saccharolyticus DSM 8903]|uniref:FMN-binding domain protein n=1 Tax=Caldicellulosiruptor saccharolyticus (strain ATCC 43494 / DSM 8903 / Tp8T 6331) TaxID=351627 RepID=A4XHG5_CALS8|nr:MULTISPECIES: FMN-binding protein [Caldicellulosiruptor]ABP66350.2 FMN-binding domain protein [Caldicellulosiruptor saccharolyticus DSM 8903]
MGIETENAEKYKGECISCIKCVEICPRYNMQLNFANQPVNPRYTSSLTVAGLFAVFSALSFLPSAKKIDTAKYNAIPSFADEDYQTDEENENINSSDNKQVETQQDYQAEIAQNNSQEANTSQNQISDQAQENAMTSKYQQNQSAAESYNSTETNQKSANVQSKTFEQAAENSQKTSLEKSQGSVQNSTYPVSSSNSSDESQQENVQANLSNATETSTQNFKVSNNTSETPKGISKIYKDGTYTGEGFGYRPGLVVEVTIKDDKITKIKIVSHNETQSFAQLPFEIIPQEIIQNQSTNVDIVSGATRTSYGIIMAVEDALNKAKIENESSLQN